MTFLRRFFAAQCYAWHRVDEYLARQRGDWAAASQSLNAALRCEREWRGI